MNNLRVVNISSLFLEKLKSKKIGEGRDAVVYSAGKDVLYKVYKAESSLVDDETLYTKKTKIYKKGNTINNKLLDSKPQYIDKHGVKIYYKEAINRIVDRQADIQLSNLPKAPLYIDDKFRGCVLKRINGMQLHKAWLLLNRKNKIKVLRTIIEEVKELTDNYIYPIDTANSPFAGKHSNILVNSRLKPELIDLDGNSTIYRESFDQELYNDVLFSLNMLFLELIYGFELGDSYEQFELDFIKDTLIKDGVDINLATKLSEYEADYEDLNNLVSYCFRKK